MHKYNKQEAPLAVVVEPYDENPVHHDPRALSLFPL